jgi:hypothetical protein
VEAAIGSDWQRVGLRQLSGMLIMVYIRQKYLVGSHTGLSCSEFGTLREPESSMSCSTSAPASPVISVLGTASQRSTSCK